MIKDNRFPVVFFCFVLRDIFPLTKNNESVGVFMEQEDLFEIINETLIVKLPEELDHHSACMIREKTDYLFNSKRIRDVIFDYQNTYFMDSSGIGLVMGRYREVRYLKGNIYIVGVNDKISRILDISGLYRVAIKSENVPDALHQIKQR